MYYIEKTDSSSFSRLIDIWESSVRCTHFFLEESDIAELRPLILNSYLPNLDVYIARDLHGVISGFIAVNENHIEMLFIDERNRGQGIGKLLIKFAITSLKVDRVDVNEQNLQAVVFYQKMGFFAKSRSEVDGQGRPFPLIHMELSNENRQQ
ncbi:GNAT family N-acetyltransferase [Dryocola sp. BD626]|uniref:GNAT family N-acetyltransferase n=1 Tax=Dryocola sp. BD626 TaxID=3133273 RepID=UPI003F4FC39F